MRMKKLLLALAIFISCPVWAKWEYYASANGDDFFFDPSTVRKVGDFSKVWTITNLSRRNKDGASSFRIRKDFDCPNERFRILYISIHTEKLARGETLASSDEPDNHWSEIPPRSSVRILHAILCAK
jgi:hypothetical protein